MLQKIYKCRPYIYGHITLLQSAHSYQLLATAIAATRKKMPRHTPHATRHTPHATRHTPHATEAAVNNFPVPTELQKPFECAAGQFCPYSNTAVSGTVSHGQLLSIREFGTKGRYDKSKQGQYTQSPSRHCHLTSWSEKYRAFSFWVPPALTRSQWSSS